MKWTYTRIKSAKCSKWVSGDNWVTKYDDEMFCAVGINGKRNHAWMIENPKEARKAVESVLSNAEVSGGVSRSDH
jgi:hypothetical protein